MFPAPWPGAGSSSQTGLPLTATAPAFSAAANRSVRMRLLVPEPSSLPFRDGIVHPDLLLWDGWSFADDETLHLYCLAVPRRDADGNEIPAAERNGVPFHVRHFVSRDGAASWRDAGCFLAPRIGEGLADSRTVWSGSVEPMSDGSRLVAYTGLRERGAAHCFTQALMLAVSDGDTVSERPEEALLCPIRDRDAILAAGYYLGPVETIGHRDGEEGGPITAWRDPFILPEGDGCFHLFWSAKISPRTGAMGHALVRRDGGAFRVEELFPPISLPDGDAITQFELPKVLRVGADGPFFLIAATCNRVDEGQSDAEVEKRIRLYLAPTLRGPWRPWSAAGSVLPGLDNLFGMTVLTADFAGGSALCMAPYTGAVGPELASTFAPPFRIALPPLTGAGAADVT